MQSRPLSNSITFSSPQNETPYPLAVAVAPQSLFPKAQQPLNPLTIHFKTEYSSAFPSSLFEAEYRPSPRHSLGSPKWRGARYLSSLSSSIFLLGHTGSPAGPGTLQACSHLTASHWLFSLLVLRIFPWLILSSTLRFCSAVTCSMKLTYLLYCLSSIGLLTLLLTFFTVSIGNS